MKYILLIAAMDAQFVELARVARLLKSTERYTPVFWFPFSYPVLERDLATCRAERWDFSCASSTSEVGCRRTYSVVKRIIQRLPIRVSFWIFFVILYRKMVGLIRYVEGQTRSLSKEYKPDLLIVSEENARELTHVSIRVCREHNIPTVIIPYTIANATEAAEYFYDYYAHDASRSLINRWTAKLFPHWVYEHRGKKLLRLPSWDIIPMERSGYRPARPWVMNSEPGTIVAVESERMLEYYRSDGLAEDKLILTGALYDDILAEATARSGEMRRKLDHELSLREGLPLLLCALPPSQFPRDCEFADYDSLLSFWMETLSRVEGWNVIVRPHPRLTDEEVNHLESFGVKISRWDTATLVPLCDLYVASVSATIRWAIACGKPVVNYDVYQMKYADYQGVTGVLTVFSKTDFKDALNRLTTDRQYYDVIENNQRREMSKWGRLDGKSSERMLQLFDDVIAGKFGRVGS